MKIFEKIKKEESLAKFSEALEKHKKWLIEESYASTLCNLFSFASGYFLIDTLVSFAEVANILNNVINEWFNFEE